MRMLCAILASALALVPAASAQESKDANIKGLYLITDYPAVTMRPGTTSTVALRLQNYGLPPERLSLKVDGVPANWSAALLGGGQPVAAAMPATNASVSLQLRVEVPQDAQPGAQTLTVAAEGQDASDFSLFRPRPSVFPPDGRARREWNDRLRAPTFTGAAYDFASFMRPRM